MKRRILAILLACMLLSSCTGGMLTGSSSQQGSSGAATSGDAELELPKEDTIHTATLLAVGDNLIHDVIYQQAARRTQNKSYDFLPAYENLKTQIAAADISFINQETPIAKSFPPSSYPLFNAPEQLAGDLKTLGFDVVNIANNHMLDKGKKGLIETMDALDAEEMLTMIGAYRSEKEYDTIPLVTKNKIKFAFVGFTQHTNGLRLPDEDAGMIVYTDELEAMERQITAARRVADVVVVSVHWGEEGTTKTTLYQQNIAKHLAKYGADIVLGTHPHVLQPVEYVDGENGHKALVFYSLGNFVSAQVEPENLVGGMANITVQKNETTGKISIVDPKLSLVITHFGTGFRDLRLYPLSDYTDKLAAEHGIVLEYGKQFNLEFINQFAEEVVDEQFMN
ncbi:CapA family protein [Hydrogenoanaerobacterium sp.]|uniref:CapA family protein n=1 Tax=Hydrogenoanaerobacterium sp. TaxID=2953763 RepID=UPI00289A8F3D|nr:CapA family protein [Hydrogenoanaerobacterium sp.]